MKVYEGMKLCPKKHISSDKDDIAEIIKKHPSYAERWKIVIVGKFSKWYFDDEIDNDFDPLHGR